MQPNLVSMNYNHPREIAQVFCQSGIEKSQTSFSKFIILAFLGGTFIALGGLLSVVVAGGIPSMGEGNPGLIKFVAGALFPVGLMMVSVAGADLFTSDCTGMVLPWLQKKVNLWTVIKILVISYFFNFIGTQFIAYVMAYQTGLITSEPWLSYLHNYSELKVNQDFYKVLIKGVGANWLVCLGTWMGYAGKDVISKCIGIWVPVMLFVTLGYEHSIANMFFIPAAIYSGADILWSEFIVNNLIPATIGNIIGGAVFVGCAYWYVYLRETKA